MELCFMEGCIEEAKITIQKTIQTRGQVGDSSCDIRLPFCSVDHAAAFERLYPTTSEQMATLARYVANFESKYLTVEQLETTTAPLTQMIDINLGGQEMVIIPREEFEELQHMKRLLAGTQHELTGLQQDYTSCVIKDDVI